MQDISSTIFHFDAAAAAALIVVLFTLGLVNLTLGYKSPLQEQAQRVDLVHDEIMISSKTKHAAQRISRNSKKIVEGHQH